VKYGKNELTVNVNVKEAGLNSFVPSLENDLPGLDSLKQNPEISVPGFEFSMLGV